MTEIEYLKIENTKLATALLEARKELSLCNSLRRDSKIATMLTIFFLFTIVQLLILMGCMFQ